MQEIIDLSQEIYQGMPVFSGLPGMKMSVHITHEEWDKIGNPVTFTPSVHKLELSEHTGLNTSASVTTPYSPASSSSPNCVFTTCAL